VYVESSAFWSLEQVSLMFVEVRQECMDGSETFRGSDLFSDNVNSQRQPSQRVRQFHRSRALFVTVIAAANDLHHQLASLFSSERRDFYRQRPLPVRQKLTATGHQDAAITRTRPILFDGLFALDVVEHQPKCI
jgi:hypothetical protein